MATDEDGLRDLFAGLRQLAESAFPKRCRSCGRIYQNAAEFVASTQPVAPDRSGLKQSLDDNDCVIVELFRNCICGSTLMDCFDNRRDPTSAGALRRQHFQRLLEQLAAKGIEPKIARRELLKVMQGQASELLRQLAQPR